MRTKFKAWAEPYIKEHPEIALSDEELNKLDGFCLEIGSGKGDFLVQMATKFPSLNFLGVERNVTCAGFSARKIVESKLTNVKFLWSDIANVTPKLKDESVSYIFLNFSDPWPKRRHLKRRLTSDLFLKEYKRILKKDGKLIFKTDNTELFNFSIETLENNNFNIISKTDTYMGEDDFDACTEYEAWFRNENTPIHRMVVMK